MRRTPVESHGYRGASPERLRDLRLAWDGSSVRASKSGCPRQWLPP